MRRLQSHVAIPGAKSVPSDAAKATDLDAGRDVGADSTVPNTTPEDVWPQQVKESALSALETIVTTPPARRRLWTQGSWNPCTTRYSHHGGVQQSVRHHPVLATRPRPRHCMDRDSWPRPHSRRIAVQQQYEAPHRVRQLGVDEVSLPLSRGDGRHAGCADILEFQWRSCDRRQGQGCGAGY